jgi:hypothetical protein
MIDPRFTKAVNNSIVVQAEENTLKAIFDSDVTYTLCDRSSVTDKKGHYFVSVVIDKKKFDDSKSDTFKLVLNLGSQRKYGYYIPKSICPIIKIGKLHKKGKDIYYDTFTDSKREGLSGSQKRNKNQPNRRIVRDANEMEIKYLTKYDYISWPTFYGIKK